MNTIMIVEPVENSDALIKYTYIIGHGFGEVEYKAEIIGRFGTPVEAEAHIDIINKEVSDREGCLAFKEEFPFLILEIVNIEFEKDVEKIGIPYKFYSFDWEKIEYVESESTDKSKVLNEYRDRANKLIKILE